MDLAQKIIQYMAVGQDNSSNIGSDIPTRSPTQENWSGIPMFYRKTLHKKTASFAPFGH
jgi:hypothetical protein